MAKDGFDSSVHGSVVACATATETKAEAAAELARVVVVTGSRADFGLLRPVMHAIDDHPRLRLLPIVTGVHLLPEVGSVGDVEACFAIAARVTMQEPTDRPGRSADVEALARGIAGLHAAFTTLNPDIVLVLGDRIEAFAAASAAAVGGRLLAHIHGGDRAEGVADDSMRHAISKLAHLHFAASEASAARLIRLGEHPQHIWTTGSPGLDDLHHVPPLDSAQLAEVGVCPHAQPVITLVHPTGLTGRADGDTVSAVLAATDRFCDGRHPLVLLAPNHDSGREEVLTAIGDRPMLGHLPRHVFIGLLRRALVLVGNSSAGLLEAPAIGIPVVNVGPRQAGRERPATVIDVAPEGIPTAREVEAALLQARQWSMRAGGPPWVGVRKTPFGDGQAGRSIAMHLCEALRHRPSLRKRIAY